MRSALVSVPELVAAVQPARSWRSPQAGEPPLDVPPAGLAAGFADVLAALDAARVSGVSLPPDGNALPQSLPAGAAVVPPATAVPPATVVPPVSGVPPTAAAPPLDSARGVGLPAYSMPAGSAVSVPAAEAAPPAEATPESDAARSPAAPASAELRAAAAGTAPEPSPRTSAAVTRPGSGQPAADPAAVSVAMPERAQAGADAPRPSRPTAASTGSVRGPGTLRGPPSDDAAAAERSPSSPAVEGEAPAPPLDRTAREDVSGRTSPRADAGLAETLADGAARAGAGAPADGRAPVSHSTVAQPSAPPASGDAAAHAGHGRAAPHESLAHGIRWMVDHRLGEARLTLNPPELGSVDVKIAVVDDQTYVQMVASSAGTREDLEQSLPRLRELLSFGGLHLADATVSGGREESSAYAEEFHPRVEPTEPHPREMPRDRRPAGGAIDVFA